MSKHTLVLSVLANNCVVQTLCIPNYTRPSPLLNFTKTTIRHRNMSDAKLVRRNRRDTFDRQTNTPKPTSLGIDGRVNERYKMHASFSHPSLSYTTSLAHKPVLNQTRFTTHTVVSAIPDTMQLFTVFALSFLAFAATALCADKRDDRPECQNGIQCNDNTVEYPYWCSTVNCAGCAGVSSLMWLTLQCT